MRCYLAGSCSEVSARLLPGPRHVGTLCRPRSKTRLRAGERAGVPHKPVKMNAGKPHPSAAGKLEGDRHHSTATPGRFVTHRCSGRILHRRKSPGRVPTGNDASRIPHKRSATSARELMRNHRRPELLLLSNRLLFRTTPANFLLLPHKVSLFIRLAYGFFHSLLVSRCNSLLFPNKPSFAGKINGSLTFKVNKSYF